MSQDPEGMELSSRDPIRKYSLLVALGGNLASSVGKPQETLKSALKLLQTSGAVIRATSTFYHTPAFPAGAGPDYVNAAAWLEQLARGLRLAQVERVIHRAPLALVHF